MVMSNQDEQSTSTAPWLSAELAATVELDTALQALLSPVHRWLNTLAVRNHSPHTLTAYFAGLNQLALFFGAVSVCHGHAVTSVNWHNISAIA